MFAYLFLVKILMIPSEVRKSDFVVRLLYKRHIINTLVFCVVEKTLHMQVCVLQGLPGCFDDFIDNSLAEQF